MSNDTERLQADRVLQVLERAKYLDRASAIQELEPLRYEVGGGKNVERERAEAWLAISALHKTLTDTSDHRDLSAHWQRAIDKTNLWLASLA